MSEIPPAGLHVERREAADGAIEGVVVIVSDGETAAAKTASKAAARVFALAILKAINDPLQPDGDWIRQQARRAQRQKQESL